METKQPNTKKGTNMKRNKMTVIAILALGGLMAFGSMANAADETKPAAPAAEKKAEAAKPAPSAADIAKLEAEVSLTEEQKTKVAALLTEMKGKRRAVSEDASLSKEDKKAKTKVVNHEITEKIKAAMTPEQYTKWEKLQQARRDARAAEKAAK
jgi:hypothetical protein